MKMSMLMCLSIFNLDPSFQGVNRLFIMPYNRANGQLEMEMGNKKWELEMGKKNIIYQELI